MAGSTHSGQSKRRKVAKEGKLQGMEEFENSAYLFDAVECDVRKQLHWSSRDKSRRLCEELYRCLVVKARAPDPRALSFSPIVEDAWHVALLNTVPYQRFCQSCLGKFLHHNTEDDFGHPVARADRIVKMREAYMFVWGASPLEEFWSETGSESHATGKDEPEEAASAGADVAPKSDDENVNGENVIKITFMDAVTQAKFEVDMERNIPIAEVKPNVYRHFGFFSGGRVVFNGGIIRYGDTPATLCLSQADILMCYPNAPFARSTAYASA